MSKPRRSLAPLAIALLLMLQPVFASAQESPGATPVAEITPTEIATEIPTETATPTVEPTITETPTEVLPTETATPEPTETPTSTATSTASPQPEPATPAASPEATFAPAATGQSISVSPSSFYPGQLVTYTIKGFTTGLAATVYWKSSSGWDDLTSFNIGANGGSSWSYYAPNYDGVYGKKTLRVWLDSNPSVYAETTVTLKQQPAATATLSSTRAIVGSTISYTVNNLYPNSRLYITWQRPGGSTVAIEAYGVDNNGNGGATFTVPATTSGPGNKVTFYTNTAGVLRSVTVYFDVVSRIKVSPGSVTRGSVVNVSLRGYGKGETVRIRWKINGAWVVVATVVASNTGSANVMVTVPANAPVGANSVRGDGTTNRQQTNAVTVTS